jgi:hypothetical protein
LICGQSGSVKPLRQFEQRGVAAGINVLQNGARPLFDDGIKQTALRGQRPEPVGESIVCVPQDVHVRAKLEDGRGNVKTTRT